MKWLFGVSQIIMIPVEKAVLMHNSYCLFFLAGIWKKRLHFLMAQTNAQGKGICVEN